MLGIKIYYDTDSNTWGKPDITMTMLNNTIDTKIVSLLGKGHMLDQDEIEKLNQITEKYKYL